MSFWDLAPPETEDDAIFSLIESQNPDIEKVLENKQLMVTFRTHDQRLVDFLLRPEIFDRITDTIFTHKNVKLSRVCVELFVLKDSPLLKFLLAQPARATKLLQNVESNDFVRVGFVTRIFECAADAFPHELTQFMSTSLDSLALLTANIEKTSVADLVQAYLQTLDGQDRWYIFAILQLFTTTELEIPEGFEKYSKEIKEFVSRVKARDIDCDKKVNLLRVIRHVIGSMRDDDIALEVLRMIPVIYKENQEEVIRIESFRIALELPRYTRIIQCAVEEIRKPLPWTEMNVLALKLLSVEPNKSFVTLLPIIFQRFEEDQHNSLLHLEFVKFVASSIEVVDLRKIILDLVPQAVLRNAQMRDWRKNAEKVGAYLNLAEIVDGFIDSPTQEWIEFRKNELCLWKTKDGNEGGASREIVGEEKESRKEESEKREKVDESFGSFPSFDEPNGGFGEFPAFEEIQTRFVTEETNQSENSTKKDKEDVFGSFPAFEETKKESQDNFGNFFDEAEENPKDNSEGDVFGSFPAFEETKKESQENFGNFFDEAEARDSLAQNCDEPQTFQEAEQKESLDRPDKPKKSDQDDVFGAFPAFDENKKESQENFGHFFDDDESKRAEDQECLESENHSKTNDADFGSFPAFDEHQKHEKEDPFGSFPAFEQTPKECQSSFGNFFTEAEANSANEDAFGAFPAFDETKKQSEENFGGFFNEELEETDSSDSSTTKDIGPVSASNVPEKSAQIDTSKTKEETPSSSTDTSFANFLSLISHPCWTHSGPSPAELFGTPHELASPSAAAAFLLS